ncbi:MAG: proline dehydrogenase family protein [Acidobacteria bacterium]|nr:proline dehydrogenase family protein [Acidobacteriota bacterium]
MLRNFIFWLSSKPAITQAIAYRGMKKGFARRFVPGESLAEAITASRELNQTRRSVSLNQLGEYVTTRSEAEAAQASYGEILRALSQSKIDGDISIKLSQLGLKLDMDLCRSLAGQLAETASSLGLDVEMDMEASADTDATLDVYEAVQRKCGNVTLAIQAYLYRSAKDLERLAQVKPKIRLVKGAYREPASIAHQAKRDVDKNYCRLLDQLFAGPFRVAIATQDPEMIRYAKESVREHAVERDHCEFQLMYGIRRDLQEQLAAEGHAVRIYVPFGAQWCPYFMRRLSERPANCWFVLRGLLTEKAKK